MATRRRKVVLTAGAVVILGIAGGGVALATGAVGGDDELTQPGTVTVDESTLPEDDAAQAEALAALATVEESAAEDAALEFVGGGEAVATELEEEDGYVVWEVEVRGEDGALQEVVIDAGDASVLGSETEEEDDDEDDDTDD